MDKVTVSIRLTKKEYELLRQAAKCYYCAPATFLRGAALEKALEVIAKELEPK